MKHKDPELLLNTAICAAINAGQKILEIYNSNDFKIEYKEDDSPLTIADKAAHEIINNKLSLTDIPILSEEGSHQPYIERKNWEYLWVVDPLDGTKEFIKQNDEFTVNIALIHNQKTVLGVIYCPVFKTLYFNYLNGGSYLVKDIGFDYGCNKALKEVSEKKQKIPQDISRNYRVVASRSHLSEETKTFIEKLKTGQPELETVSIGSSLKLCLLAEGKADIYPRFAPTMEWDTAAGHAIVKAAGGNVINNDTNKEVTYNKENLLNPWFIAKSKK
ncbi:MAG: 3'(2'),5'-bisphosphate nucleotidase [Bacteroidetes bacterium 4572_117]|nr:MAG: 3'(2'),5'-bisphosphate nucleotidase [Bacteroidetes bacterium 4572_117]